MAGSLRVGITRDNLRPDGRSIFDESAFAILRDAGIEYEFLPDACQVRGEREVPGKVPNFHR